MVSSKAKKDYVENFAKSWLLLFVFTEATEKSSYSVSSIPRFDSELTLDSLRKNTNHTKWWGYPTYLIMLHKDFCWHSLHKGWHSEICIADHNNVFH